MQWYVESQHTVPFVCTVKSLQCFLSSSTQPDALSVLLFHQSLWVVCYSVLTKRMLFSACNNYNVNQSSQNKSYKRKSVAKFLMKFVVMKVQISVLVSRKCMRRRWSAPRSE